MNRLLALLPLRRIVPTVVVVALVLGGYQLFDDSRHTTFSAYFTNTTGLYVGDDVRVLGVKIGKVTGVQPQGTQVLVTMSVDSGQPVPESADAAIVAPSLVSGRFVQLAPAWKSGPRLHDGATIPVDRTTIPVSFDDVKQELTDLSAALGPTAKDRNGSLSRAITELDTNLKAGNGAQLRSSIAQLRAAANTLSDGRSNLFATVSNLNSFTKNLAVNDAAVQSFTQELASVSGVLDQNRTDLTGAIASLGSALQDTRGFLATNRATIADSVAKSNALAATLADRSNELAGVLHVAPTALDNLQNIIEDQAITARASLANLDSVAQLVCGAVLGAGGTAAQCASALKPLLDLLGLDQIASSGGLSAVLGGSGGSGSGGLLGGLLGGSTGGTGGTGGLGPLLGGLLGTSGGTGSGSGLLGGLLGGGQ